MNAPVVPLKNIGTLSEQAAPPLLVGGVIGSKNIVELCSGRIRRAVSGVVTCLGLFERCDGGYLFFVTSRIGHRKILWREGGVDLRICKLTLCMESRIGVGVCEKIIRHGGMVAR